MLKIVIIGANEFQKPLILKAKEMGLQTHVFAWEEGAVAKNDADYFYPISIVEKDEILKRCQEIKPNAITTIASDLAMITVQYVASRLGLPCNSDRSIAVSTNKFLMRQAFQEAGIPIPFFKKVDETFLTKNANIKFPVIVKPTDRSGSRAITKLYDNEGLDRAVEKAVCNSFERKAIIEEYLDGAEYSMESISYHGHHTALAITKKYTTGHPNFIEIGHIEPSGLSKDILDKAKMQIFKALDSLDIQNGASHAEFKVTDGEEIRIIEIGARMGGDCIGSDLVYMSTGYDYTKMVIDIALGKEPQIVSEKEPKVAVIRFILDQSDLENLRNLEKEIPNKIVFISEISIKERKEVIDSSTRMGFYILECANLDEAKKYTRLESCF